MNFKNFIALRFKQFMVLQCRIIIATIIPSIMPQVPLITPGEEALNLLIKSMDYFPLIPKKKDSL